MSSPPQQEQEQQQEQQQEQEQQQGQQQEQTVVSIEIPEGAEPGDVLTFVVDDNELEFEIPPGSMVGDVLQIQLSATTTTTMTTAAGVAHHSQEDFDDDEDDDGDDDDDIMTSIVLSNGTTLDFYHNLPSSTSATTTMTTTTTTTTMRASKTTNETNNTPNHDDGTHSMIWPCARVMVDAIMDAAADATAADGSFEASSLSSLSSLLFPMNAADDDDDDDHCVLELGSGLGVVGLAYASAVANVLAASKQQPQQQQHNNSPDPFEQHDETKKKPTTTTTTATTSSPSSSVVVVLTDCAAAIPLLEHNIVMNHFHTPTNQNNNNNNTNDTDSTDAVVGVTVRAETLEWSCTPNHHHHHHKDDHGGLEEKDNDTTTTSASDRRYSLLLGSDLLYNVEMIPALISTIQQHVNDSDPYKGACTVVLLGVRWRKPELERVFFTQTEELLGMEWTLWCHNNNKNTTTMMMCDLDWKDFGNPHSEASNRYMMQTMISIGGGQAGGGGVPKSIGQITEDDIESMSEQEYDLWERAHIQIYIGQRRTGKPHQKV